MSIHDVWVGKQLVDKLHEGMEGAVPLALDPARHYVEDAEQSEQFGRSEGWDLDFVQLSPGAYGGLYRMVSLPGVLLTFEGFVETSVAYSGTMPSGLMPISLPLCTGSSLRVDGRLFVGGDAIVHWDKRDIDVVIEGGYATHFVQLEREPWRAIIGALPWLADPDGSEIGSGPSLSSSVTFRLNQALSTVLGTRTSEPSVQLTERTAGSFATQIVSSLVEGLSGPGEEPPESARNRYGERPLYLARVRDFMALMQHEPLSLPALCAAAGVNARTLSYSFVRHYGVSPVRFHALKRMEGARRDLKHAGPDETTVTGVATEWGFWHLGRFSQAYRNQFGEAPSQTLMSRASQVSFSALEVRTIFANKAPSV